MKTESRQNLQKTQLPKQHHLQVPLLSQEICDVRKAGCGEDSCFRLCRRDASLENRFKEDSRLSVTFV